MGNKKDLSLERQTWVVMTNLIAYLWIGFVNYCTCRLLVMLQEVEVEMMLLKQTSWSNPFQQQTDPVLLWQGPLQEVRPSSCLSFPPPCLIPTCSNTFIAILVLSTRCPLTLCPVPVISLPLSATPSCPAITSHPPSRFQSPDLPRLPHLFSLSLLSTADIYPSVSHSYSSSSF